MSAKKIIIGAIVVLFIVWVAYLLMTKNTEAPINTDGEVNTNMPVPGTDTVDTEVVDQTTPVTVTYTDQGFSPSTVTVKKDESVTFINASSKGMWVASAFHPTHEVYPAFDELKSVTNGESYTFKFDRVGQWKYHNHVGPSHFGTVVVE